MSDFDGIWKTVTMTPMGEQQATLVLSSEGGQLTGTNRTAMGEVTIEDGVIDGNAARWAMRIRVPFPMMLEANVTIEGDTLAGTVKAGMLGTSRITGTRMR